MNDRTRRVYSVKMSGIPGHARGEFWRIAALACVLAIGLGLVGGGADGADWPVAGHDNTRNMVATEPGLPATADSGKAADNGLVDLKTTRNVQWVAKLGSQSYGNVTVSKGRVFVGTNNASALDPKLVGDLGVLLCLDDKSGDLLWQYAAPKLKAGKVSDWEEVGLCSSPTVDEQSIFAVTNRCEVVRLSWDGQVVWRYDMRDELGVFPHNMTSSSVLVLGNRLFVTTSNGVDWTAKHLPAPDAPALICLDKQTGKLLARERSGISARTFYSNWSSPAAGSVNGRQIVVFGGGDGFVYGFDPEPGPVGPDGVPTLTELWRCDANPPEYRGKGGKAVKYGDRAGPSEVIATPTIVDGKVYAAVGQEPEQGDGAGCLNCIDASGHGDVTGTGIVWRNAKVGRSLSSVTVAGDLIYFPEYSGIVHCLRTKDGSEVWAADTEAHIWGGALVADSKVYVGNENGALTVLAAGPEKKVLSSIDFKEAIDSSPVAANGAVYVQTMSQLYCLREGVKR